MGLIYTILEKRKIYIVPPWHSWHFLQNFRLWQNDCWYFRSEIRVSNPEWNKKIIENKTYALFTIFVKSHQFTEL